MQEMSVQDFKNLQDSGEPFQFIDVREPYEFEEDNLGAQLIPMNEVLDRVTEIARDKKVVVHCRSGKRSASVIKALEQMHGFDKLQNLYNLEGGILAYREEIG